MGVARLLAKGWVLFCLFAGIYALDRAGTSYFLQILLTLFLFGAMGLLFIGGYAAASSGSGPLVERLRPHHFAPSFNGIVFMAFVLASVLVQMFYAPAHIQGGLLGALQAAIAFAVPEQDRLSFAFGSCGLDGGRIFASAFAWLLAFIFLGSSLSRIRLAAGIVRLERKARPDTLGAPLLALVLGFAAVIGIQFLYVGTLFSFLPCSVLSGIAGDVLIGIAPLMLTYLIVAALTNLLALGPEA